MASGADEHVRYFDGDRLVGNVVCPKNCNHYVAYLSYHYKSRSVGDRYRSRDKAERSLERAYRKEKEKANAGEVRTTKG